MRIGISAYDLDVRDLVELAAAADELGFESLWLGEHIVLPIGYSSGHPATGNGQHDRRSSPAAQARPIVDPATKLVDPLVALAGCASRTRSILLATGIYLVPLRSPVVTARMVHTLQGLSSGRFLLGAGAGWLEEEFAAVGVPFERRGERLEENLEVIRKALAGGPFRHEGRLHQLDGLQLCEDPVSVPVILGGNTERALRRAARLGDGWFASGTPDLAEACRRRDRVLALRDEAGGGEFSVHVRVSGADPDVIQRYAGEGFDRVVVWADQIWPGKGDDARAARPHRRGLPRAGQRQPGGADARAPDVDRRLPRRADDRRPAAAVRLLPGDRRRVRCRRHEHRTRPRDLRQPPVLVRAVAQASMPGPQPGEMFPVLMRDSITELPARYVAETLYRRAGMGPADIDVAQLYDCFTITVLLQLEDWGFCKKGEGGPFAASGALDLGGELPINTGGGHLSEGYIHGMNHILEGVRQIRGTSTSQVAGAQTCLVATTPLPPGSGLILRAA